MARSVLFLRNHRRIWLAGAVALFLLVFLAAHHSEGNRATAEEAAPAGGEPTPLKRRDTLSAQKLEEQLRKTPAIDLHDGSTKAAKELGTQIHQAAQGAPSPGSLRLPSLHGTSGITILAMQLERWKAEGFAARVDGDCLTLAEPARQLEANSTRLRRGGFVSVPLRGEWRPATQSKMEHLDKVLDLKTDEPLPAHLLPALTQMLQCEDEPSRKLLVKALARINTPAASAALAQRAIYDLAPEVRVAAVEVLKQRKPDDYRTVLLDGLRYPWVPIADHAAETLVAVEDRDALPLLAKLSKAADPRNPFTPAESDGARKVRELVRVNHLNNCLMCHAPANNANDLVLGPVPTPGELLPQEYYGRRRINPETPFVRADVTYVRQDFSVMQMVENAKPWPKQQRFDFLVRTRDATAAEQEAAPKTVETYPQREAVLWAIAELKKGGAVGK